MNISLDILIKYILIERKECTVLEMQIIIIIIIIIITIIIMFFWRVKISTRLQFQKSNKITKLSNIFYWVKKDKISKKKLGIVTSCFRKIVKRQPK